MTKARNTGFIGCKVTKFIFIAQIKWKTFSYMRIYFMIYIIKYQHILECFKNANQC